jgi:hypothetical protein
LVVWCRISTTTSWISPFDEKLPFKCFFSSLNTWKSHKDKSGLQALEPLQISVVVAVSHLLYAAGHCHEVKYLHEEMWLLVLDYLAQSDRSNTVTVCIDTLPMFGEFDDQ